MSESIWQGRYDGEDLLAKRLFQIVTVEKDYTKIQTEDFIIHGFAVDEGVARNKGRVGAKDAPDIIRKNMCNFSVFNPEIRICDFGNVECHEGLLEFAQADLAAKVRCVLQRGAKSIVLGGGHEVTYAHYSGVKAAYPKAKVGIINFDAHFDNRELDPSVGATSGTGFWQIAHEGDIHSLHIGIQKNSNTLRLFHTAHEFGMKYILADEVFYENLNAIYAKVDDLLNQVDVIYVTICMDVFNASIAPGVSATSYNGMFCDHTVLSVFRHILKNSKMKALDVAEVNPKYDIADRTARLAACLVNEWIMI